MKVKTSEATSSQIDWLVARIEGHQYRCAGMLEEHGYRAWQGYEDSCGSPTPPYSTDWSKAGEIIEREEIAVQCCYCDGKLDGWVADSRKLNPDEGMEQYGPTPLIAAMRCFCVSRFGDEADVPDGVS